MNSRLLGTLCMVGGAAYVIMAIYTAVTGRTNAEGSDTLGQLLSLIWVLGAICGWLGFILIRGTGNNVAIRFLSFVPVLGLVWVAIVAVYALFTNTSVFEVPFGSTGLLVELVGIVLVAIFAIATKALPGWRKFVPLIILLGVILGGVITGVSQGAIYGIPLMQGLTHILFGYAVWSFGASPARVAQPA